MHFFLHKILVTVTGLIFRFCTHCQSDIKSSQARADIALAIDDTVLKT